MSAVEEILAQIPISQLAGRLGVDEQTVEQATRSALPALLGGMRGNAEDSGGSDSLAEAVRQHDPGLVEGGVNLDDVDDGDGRRIVGHVFGDQHEQVAQRLGDEPGTGGQDLMRQLLPILAPIVMSYLAKRFGGGGSGSGSGDGSGDGGGGGGGGIGDLLGGLLGGGGSGGGLLGGLGDALGGVLGGSPGGGRDRRDDDRGDPDHGDPDHGDPDRGGLLGGLLGGGRKQ